MKKLTALVVALSCALFVSGPVRAQDESPEKQELLNRIEDLEKRINELTEESRARRKLEITEQERQEKEKEVLEAVGREYTLDPKNSLGLDYSVSYAYSPADSLRKNDANQYMYYHESNHTVRHTISTSYSALDNLAVSTSVPFVYKYNKMGTEEKVDETDIGDIIAGVMWQPMKSKAGSISTTINLNATLPTGRSPYKINPETELSTGDGIYAFSLGGSFSKQIDPVIAFWSLIYTYNMDADGLSYRVTDTQILEEVETGDEISVSAGLAYALSYKVSVNASVNYAYTLSSRLHYKNVARPIKIGDDTTATFGLGVGWRASNKTTLVFNMGYELTGSAFSFTFRAPFTFVL